jgi:serine/threonine-protein kinase
MKRSFANGRYEVVDTLGCGGMGEVFAVRIVATGGRAALKAMRADIGRSDARLERFRREATVMGTLEHPHIVRSFDYGVEDDGTAFVVMELLDGVSMHEDVKQNGPMAVPRAVRLFRQVASALHAAHEAGIVHRDVKPSNIMIVRAYDGREMAKVVDFGIAAIRSGLERLTVTGQIIGTPAFMAPEQLLGESVSRLTDGYAVAATMYAVLAGRPPYPPADVTELVPRVVSGDRAPLRVVRPDVGPLAMLIDRAMAVDPGDRFPTTAAFADAIARFEETSPAASRPPTIAAVRHAPPRDPAPPSAPEPTRRPRARVALLAAGSAAVLAAALATIALVLAAWPGDPTEVAAAPLDAPPPVRPVLSPTPPRDASTGPGAATAPDAGKPPLEASDDARGADAGLGSRGSVRRSGHRLQRRTGGPSLGSVEVVRSSGDAEALRELLRLNDAAFRACMSEVTVARAAEVRVRVGAVTNSDGEPYAGGRQATAEEGATEPVLMCARGLLETASYRGPSFDVEATLRIR